MNSTIDKKKFIEANLDIIYKSRDCILTPAKIAELQKSSEACIEEKKKNKILLMNGAFESEDVRLYNEDASHTKLGNGGELIMYDMDKLTIHHTNEYIIKNYGKDLGLDIVHLKYGDVITNSLSGKKNGDFIIFTKNKLINIKMDIKIPSEPPGRNGTYMAGTISKSDMNNIELSDSNYYISSDMFFSPGNFIVLNVGDARKEYANAPTGTFGKDGYLLLDRFTKKITFSEFLYNICEQAINS